MRGIIFSASGQNGPFTITGDYAEPRGFGIGGSLSGVKFDFCKFFPYDNGNGQPIYNTDNGAELRDPVTGLPVN